MQERRQIEYFDQRGQICLDKTYTPMASRNYSVEQSNVSYKINETFFTNSVSSETKCNQKVIIAIKVIKAGLRKLK